MLLFCVSPFDHQHFSLQSLKDRISKVQDADLSQSGLVSDSVYIPHLVRLGTPPISFLQTFDSAGAAQHLYRAGRGWFPSQREPFTQSQRCLFFPRCDRTMSLSQHGQRAGFSVPVGHRVRPPARWSYFLRSLEICTLHVVGK